MNVILVSCFEPGYAGLYVDGVLKYSGSYERLAPETALSVLDAVGIPVAFYDMSGELYDTHLDGAGFPAAVPAWLSDCTKIR